MTRISVKLSTCATLVVVAVLVGATATVHGQVQANEQVGPGVAGQVHAAAYDPLDSDTMYVGGDVSGVFVTRNHGQDWEPFNRGFADDVNAVYGAMSYVDDLLVIAPDTFGTAAGVYAATHGGIYYNSGNRWELQTRRDQFPEFYYMGGWASKGGTYPEVRLPIPFSCLAYDASSGVLYAGAGNARFENGASSKWDNYYPAPGTSSPDFSGGPFSLWRCNLRTAPGQWQGVALDGGSNKGMVRDIEILTKAGQPSKVAFATDAGVFVGTPSTGSWDCVNVWVGSTKSFPIDSYWSTTVWSLGAGCEGRLYAAKAASFTKNSSGEFTKVSDPGVYWLDAYAAAPEVFELGVRTHRVFLPDCGGNRTSLTWGGVIANPLSNLLGLTVVPGSSPGADEVFVGERTVYENTGYYRFGTYQIAPGNIDTSWLAVLYMDVESGAAPGMASTIYRGVNCFGSPGTSATDARVYPGWVSHYAIHAITPLLVHPSAPRRMMAFAYHVPMAFDSATSGWQQRYSTGSGDTDPDPDHGSWKSNGLNMAGPTDIAFTGSPPRLVIADEDFTGFMETESGSGEFKWLDWYEDGIKDGRDIAVLPHADGSESVLFLRGTPVTQTATAWDHFGFAADGIKSNRQKQVIGVYDPAVVGYNPGADSFHWRYLSRALDSQISSGAFKIIDIEVAGPDTLFAACVSGSSGPWSIFRGIYAAGNFSWVPWGSSLPSAARIVEMRHVPRSRRLLVATADDAPGVYSLDTYDPAACVTWLDGNAGGYAGRTLEHVTTIECDRLGKVVYVGSRGDFTDLNGDYWGAVWQLVIPTGRAPLPGDWRLIANRDLQDNSFGFPDASAIADWDAGWLGVPYQRLTGVQDIAIDPGNPYHIYAGLGFSGLREQGTFHSTNGVWTCLATPDSAVAWSQVYPAGQQAEPSRGVRSLAIDPSNPTQLYVGTMGQELYRVEVTSAAHPAIALQAVYPLLAVTADSTVIAIHIACVDSVRTATADLSGLGCSGVVLTLHDNGKGDDIKENDGIFTSPRFVATLTDSVSYSARVFAQAYDGGYDQKDVTFEVVASQAKFVNQSAQTGDLRDLLTAHPYSAVYFKSKPGIATSDNVMVVTFDDNSTAPLILSTPYSSEGAPQFQNRGAHLTGGWIADDLPLGSRGVCYADYDNDGDTDFFICNPTYGGKIYQNRLNEAPSRFVNVTSAVCGLDSVYLQGAVAAAWGDYNADGYLDLVVNTTNYYDSLKVLDANMVQGLTYSHTFFKNGHGVTLHKSAFNVAPITNNLSLGACWADMDNDGDLEGVTTQFVGACVVVHENSGYFYEGADNFLSPSSWSVPGNFWGANSASVIDYDHDLYPDLLITEATELPNVSFRVRILRNNCGSGTRSFTPIEITSGALWNGSVVADFNLDGQDDFMLLPADDGVEPAVFMANGYSTSPSYRDLGYTLGIRGGATGGGFAADFDGDRDYDLLLGRITGDQFLYMNEGQSAAGVNSLVVNLSTLGESNSTLIGTTVSVELAGHQWTKTVDGGSGRGGQRTSTLLFGLGNATGTVTGTVHFPSGQVVPISVEASSSAVANAVEDGVGAIVSNSTVCQNEFQPGLVDWVFRWKTDVIRGDPGQDQVTYKLSVNDPESTLMSTTPGVIHLIYKDGTAWQHELRWPNLVCESGLSCRFKVTSRAGPGGSSVTSPSWLKSPSVTYCLPPN
jgi:hypothetical protein